jgi:hypothetical protein
LTRFTDPSLCHDRDDPKFLLSGDLIEKARFFKKKHSSYSDTTLQNDIALLYLSADVTLNNYIQTACIPTSPSTSYPGENIDVYAAGWGLLSSADSTGPNLLYNVKLSTYAASLCPYSSFDSAGMICAG